MTKPDFDFDDAGSRSTDTAGTPEGDLDFETDNLPSTGETSSGGQLNTGQAEHGSHESPRRNVSESHHPTGLEKVIDEISTGKIQP